MQDNSFVYPMQVKDLWLQNQKKWNTDLIDKIFQEPLASCIKQTTIIDSQDDDILCWKLTQNGKCNSKSAYKACLQKLFDQGEPRPRQVSPQTTQLLKII